MIITFLRHATAEDRSLGIPDPARALTEKGKNQVKRVASFCQNRLMIPQTLFCSPLERAKQTAILLHDRLPKCPYPQVVSWLGIETSPYNIIAELSKLDDHHLEDVWLVGHEPDFSSTIGLLLHTSSDNILIKKASLTQLDVDFTDDPTATLLWSIPCSLLP
jgi:phosphohistidine phosphatase SixA